MADLRRRTGPVLAVPEGGDGGGVRASLVVDPNGERASDAAPMLCLSAGGGCNFVWRSSNDNT